MNSTKSTLYCSFCGKSQYEVKKLISGPTALICDECAALCVLILFADGIMALPCAIPEGAFSVERIEKMQFSSVDDFLSKGGVEKREGPYTGREIIAAMCAVFSPKLYQDARSREADEIRSQLAAIDERAQKSEQHFETERAPLLERLASLGQGQPGVGS